MCAVKRGLTVLQVKCSTMFLLLLLLYFPLGYPKGNGPKARGSPGEKEMKTIVKNEDEW